MPAPLLTQTVIACIWDFDRTLIPGNMQAALFAAYGVDADEFWEEVAGLVDYHAMRGETVSPDAAYLIHLLTYVREGRLEGLTNQRLRELGAALTPMPGMPEFLTASRQHVAEIPELAREGIAVEHYVVSSGIRPMIEGSVFAPFVDGIWANTFIEEPAPSGYLDQLPIASSQSHITHVGYSIDHTSKTRVVFEINKGVNRDPAIDVHAPLAEDRRRVPLRNMIYIADGPSDVPVFSVLNTNGGKTLGVYTREPENNEESVRTLLEQGRVHAVAPADYRPGEPAAEWLLDAIEQIGYEITETRRQAYAGGPERPLD